MQDEEIDVYLSDRNLSEKLMIPKYKNISFGGEQYQSYNYQIWHFPSMVPVVIFQGILHSTPLLRIKYILEHQYK